MPFADGELSIGKYDNLLKLNGEEREFAQALDRADFVEWWHRNPDRKPYAVRLVRGEHQNYFHPDFVVCLSHARKLEAASLPAAWCEAVQAGTIQW